MLAQFPFRSRGWHWKFYFASSRAIKRRGEGSPLAAAEYENGWSGYHGEVGVSYINRMGYRLQSWFEALWSEQERRDKFFVDNDGKMVEVGGTFQEKRTDIRFPVNLAVRYGEGDPKVYENFVLNISKGGVYIITEQPLPKGAIIVMHFFVPPQQKLLAEFAGEVVGINQSELYPPGMHVEFFDVRPESVSRLEGFLEGKRSLLNVSV